MRDTASLVAEQSGPVRELFELGATDWGSNAVWDDYAALGLRAEHAPALAAILRDLRFGPPDPEGREPTDEEERWGWMEVHVPRALATLGGPEAAPALLHLAKRVCEERDFGDVVTDGLDRWLAELGREATDHCLSVIGRPGNVWLVESAALDHVANWLAEHPGPEADAMKAEATRRLLDAIGRPRGEDAATTGNRVYFLGEWRVTEALPSIEAAFEEGLVDPGHSGTLEDVRRRMNGLEERWRSHPLAEALVGANEQGEADRRAAKAYAKKKKRKKRKKRR